MSLSHGEKEINLHLLEYFGICVELKVIFWDIYAIKLAAARVAQSPTFLSTLALV